MALNYSYPKDKFETEVEEGFRSLFSERGDQFVLTGITGIKPQADFDNVQRALTHEKNNHKQTKDRFRPITFNGASIVELNDDDLKPVIEAFDGYAELKAKAESAGKTDDAKINQLVEERLKGKLAPVERDLKAKTDALTAAAEKIAQFETEKRQRTIHDAVRQAITETKVGKFEPTAVDDALLLAERIFDVDDQGNVAIKDNVGYTPGVNAAEWLIEIADRKKHWFGETVGGEAKGAKLNGKLGDNPWTANNWNKTKQGEFILANGEEKAKQAAAAAGSSIDAIYPPKPK